MPREISDIKSFIEICRRKDASCTFHPTLEIAGDGVKSVESAGNGAVAAKAAQARERIEREIEYLADFMSCNSCAREEERRQADQVQGPLQPRALHPCPQGQRQG